MAVSRRGEQALLGGEVEPLREERREGCVVGGCTAPGAVSGTALSNFFLWAWIFHDFDDDDYEEEYGEINSGFGGWAVRGVGAFGIWFLIRSLRRRSIR